MAKKWNMIVDIERCNNCRGCFLAVKDEHTGNEFPGYAAEQPAMGANWLEIEKWTGVDTWKPVEVKPEEAA